MTRSCDIGGMWAATEAEPAGPPWQSANSRFYVEDSWYWPSVLQPDLVVALADATAHYDEQVPA